MLGVILSWTAVILLGMAATGLLISRDWRWSLGLLAGQYVAATWLVAQHWPIGMASVKLVTGWMATAALGMTNLGLPEQGETKSPSQLVGIPFRLFGAGIIILASVAAAPRVEALTPGIGLPVIIGSLVLIGAGMLHLSTTSHILRVVISLLTILSGFEILYAAVEASILVAALLAVANLGLALAGSYLLVNSHVPTEEDSA